MRRRFFLHLFLGVFLFFPLGQVASGAHSTIQVRTIPAFGRTASSPIDINPEDMEFTGDVTKASTCADPVVCSLFLNTPLGTILLGVDPTTADMARWDGGAAAVSLPIFSSPVVLVLKVSVPELAGRGLFASTKSSSGSILLDGKLFWEKRTDLLLPTGLYYALERQPLITTLVLAPATTHRLTFQVPAHTAWEISLVQLIANAPSATIRGIGYSPYRDCQYPGGTHQPTTQQIQDDLFRLSHTANAIRTYSAVGSNSQVPALAHQLGLKVFPGAWIDYPKTTMAQDDSEINGLISLACANTVQGVIVGNEYYLRHRSQEAIDYLIGRIQQVKQGLNACGKVVPITTAEIDDLAFQWQSPISTTASITVTGISPIYKPVIDQLDFVMEHIYPFWSGLPIEGAAAYTMDRYAAAQAELNKVYPGENKWLIIGEAGWPSAGGANGMAVPNAVYQSRYMLEFMALAEQKNVQYLYFDAFDELWKIEEPGGVGKHWGYSYTDRSAKYNYYGVLIPAVALPQPVIDSHQVFLPVVESQNSQSSRKFPVFDEWPEGPGHFVPSGWMGDYNNIDMMECHRQDPHGGEMSAKVTFSPGGSLGWGGVYWQYPENNWGTLPEGLDLSWANKVTFWARGETGTERIRFFVGGIGTKIDPFPDSLRPAVDTGFIQLTTQWQQYTINLVGQNLSHLIGGFGWATDVCANPNGATFYLDDIFFENEPNLPAPPSHGSTFDVYTDAAVPGNHFIPSGWMGDAANPGSLALSECWAIAPHSGSTSIRIDYHQPSIGWAGIYWLHPAGNWGDRPGGYDLRGAIRLTFWARSDTANAPVKFVIGGAGYATDFNGNAICSQPIETYPDSICPKIIEVKYLPAQWTPFTILLPPGRDYHKVVAGFGVVVESPVVLYLDDIVYHWDTAGP